LLEWNRAEDTPQGRLFCYIDMMVNLKDEIYQHGCPVGSVCSELIKLRNIHQSDAVEMIGLFRHWMVKQFMAMGYDRKKADQLAMHLLSRTQGISLMASAFTDKTFLLREMKDLKEWISEL